MSKYLIKVESTNPEFPLDDERFAKGIESDGFAILTFDKDGMPDAVCLHEVNIDMISKAIVGSDQFMSAAFIAEGLYNAREYKKKSMTSGIGGLASLLGGLRGNSED